MNNNKETAPHFISMMWFFINIFITIPYLIIVIVWDERKLVKKVVYGLFAFALIITEFYKIWDWHTTGKPIMDDDAAGTLDA